MLQLHYEKMGQTLKLINDPEFLKVKNTLDNLMKKRAAECVSEKNKAADPITFEAEEELWRQNILGSDNPNQLRDTVMYLIGLTFALRGGKEHRSLMFTFQPTNKNPPNFIWSKVFGVSRRCSVKEQPGWFDIQEI